MSDHSLTLSPLAGSAFYSMSKHKPGPKCCELRMHNENPAHKLLHDSFVLWRSDGYGESSKLQIILAHLVMPKCSHWGVEPVVAPITTPAEASLVCIIISNHLSNLRDWERQKSIEKMTFKGLYVALMKPILEYSQRASSPHLQRDIVLMERMATRMNKGISELRPVSRRHRVVE